ncbi:MAG: hypothetical protein LBC19_01605 [Tannerella sp.]|jgi:hypothetical protein|nr:hypothetical protein [Tannerella sp.]
MFWIILLILILILIFGWWAIPIIIIVVTVTILATPKRRGTETKNQPYIHSVPDKSTSENNARRFRSIKDVPNITNTTPHKKPKNPQKPKNPHPSANTVITTLPLKNEPSIIDVTPVKEPENSYPPKKQTFDVPYWAHQYVYSYSEINNASREQKDFYFHFKNRFLNGECLDLNGNLNYAFILLFDLLNYYDKHGDIAKLENQLKLLGQYYPKTKSYANSFLIKRMENAGDYGRAARIREEVYDFWKLGVKYREMLNLDLNQVELLNSILYSHNNFNAIDFCMKEIIKLYLPLVDELKNKYVQEGTTLDAEFESVATLIAKQKYNYPKDLNTINKHLVDGVVCELHSNIFRYCENAVREFYGHKRKITIDIDYKTKTKELYEAKIYSKITELLPDLVLKITQPDDATEIELNSQNTTRWKTKFKILTENYTDNPKEFVNAVIALGKLNESNPSVEVIFFEASKFIAKHDNISALSLYIHYLYHDLESSTFDNRQLTKTVQKSLFKNNEQVRDFETIVSKLIQSRDLDKALKDVSSIYAQKRKKIQLNADSVEEVRHQHSGTVELLNEYLQDDYEDENNAIKTREINNDEIEIEIIQKAINAPTSPYISSIPFSPVHISLLALFAKNNLSVLQCEIETFAKSKGLFKNQIIENVNSVCYEQLDDNLIEEEDDEYYTINPNYYQTILVK